MSPRKLIFLLCLLAAAPRVAAQPAITDSLRGALARTRTDTGRAILLYKLSYYYQMNKPDSALLLAVASEALSRKAHFERGKSTALGLMGAAYNRLGNYDKALECYTAQLPLLEKSGDAQDIASAYLSIALVYDSQKDIVAALRYARRADSAVRAGKVDALRHYVALNTGEIYSHGGQPDSALLYTRQAYEEALRQGDSLIAGTALNNMGNIYFSIGRWGDALAQYRRSRPWLEAMQDYNTLAEGSLGAARSLDKLGMPDSARAAAGAAYRLASGQGFLATAMEASRLLSALYREQGALDSLVAYQDIFLVLKDSFANAEKIRHLENLTVTEQLREQALERQRAEEKHEHSQQMQLIAIAVFIPLLLLLSLFVSGKPVRPRLVRFMGVISLLFLFEYITLLLHPVVQRSAHHAPVFEILLFVCIAAVLSPLHHRVEHALLERLTRRGELRRQHAEERARLLAEAAAAREEAAKKAPTTE